MRFNIIFANSVCLPNQMYQALPVLAGALRDAGHATCMVDLNLLAMDRFLTVRSAEHYLSLAHSAIDQETMPDFARSLAEMEPKVRAGEQYKNVIRSPELGYDQAASKESFWGAVDALAFYYQLDRRISPHEPNFREELVQHLDALPWSPLMDLYESDLLPAVFEGDPQALGIVLAFPEQVVEALRLAKLVRERRPDVHVCIGGPLISLQPDKWLTDGWLLDHVDSVCVGDGELTVVELAAALEGGGSLASVTNLVWRTSEGELVYNDPVPKLTPMSAVPVPNFDHFDLGLYLFPEPVYPMMISRGCYWGRCTFCSIGWRENYRVASEEKIRADVLDLARRGVKCMQLQDSSVPPRAARLLARIVREEGLVLNWGGGMKFEACFLDPEYCQELADGGCVSLLMGFESAEQRILDLMDKGYRAADCERMLTNLRAAGISVEMLWFIGFPGETRTDALSTIRWLYTHRHLFSLTAFVGDYLMHPDTIVYDDPERFGVTLKDSMGDHMTYSVAEGMQPEEARELKRMLSVCNNRTMTCAGFHVPHLARERLGLRELGRPMEIAPEVLAFCEGSGSPPGSPRSALQ